MRHKDPMYDFILIYVTEVIIKRFACTQIFRPSQKNFSRISSYLLWATQTNKTYGIIPVNEFTSMRETIWSLKSFTLLFQKKHSSRRSRGPRLIENQQSDSNPAISLLHTGCVSYAQNLSFSAFFQNKPYSKCCWVYIVKKKHEIVVIFYQIWWSKM